ncbi:uncharacterized protein [Musca autumnalis]|uniref:uncharacterized protein n=1 Tax=Musca autumnalis TaxID=221902 RepID=UPI003CF57B8A
MNNILSILVIVCLFLMSNQIVADKDIPWFVHDDNMYFIDTQANYTSENANNVCIKKNMLYKLFLIDIKHIMPLVAQYYDNVQAVWSFQNYNLGHHTKNYNINFCYKVNTINSEIVKTDCNEKLAVVCKRQVTGATLYNFDGTQEDIDADEVAEYCNPHSEEYDKKIQLCLVHFYTADVDLKQTKRS